MPPSSPTQADHHECTQMLDAFVHQQGDLGAQLLSTLQRYIQYCGYKLHPLTRDDQQEILQEVAITLLQRYKQLKKDCNGWLFTIVRNQYIDQLRKQQRQVSLVEPHAHHAENTGNTGSTGDADHQNFVQNLPCPHSSHQLYNETECLEHIFDHIEQQPTGAMDITIYTHHAFGLSNAEISAQTGRTAGAIAKRLSLLRQRIQQLRERLC